MLVFNSIRRFLAVFSVALLVLPGGLLEARTKKGDKLLKLAQQAEQGKEYEKALDLYTQAYSQDPSDPSTSWVCGESDSKWVRFMSPQVRSSARREDWKMPWWSTKKPIPLIRRRRSPSRK